MPVVIDFVLIFKNLLLNILRERMFSLKLNKYMFHERKLPSLNRITSAVLGRLCDAFEYLFKLHVRRRDCIFFSFHIETLMYRMLIVTVLTIIALYVSRNKRKYGRARL